MSTSGDGRGAEAPGATAAATGSSSGPPSRRSPAAGRARRQALSWALLAVVVVTTLAVGGFGPRSPRGPGERAQALAEEIACPQCAGESVAQSNAPAAVNIYREIERQVADGRSDDEIRAYLARQFGEDVLLRPSATGPAVFVWAVPVAAAVVAAAGLAVAFRRWARSETAAPSPEDRALVEAYLADAAGSPGVPAAEGEEGEGR